MSGFGSYQNHFPGNLGPGQFPDYQQQRILAASGYRMSIPTNVPQYNLPVMAAAPPFHCLNLASANAIQPGNLSNDQRRYLEQQRKLTQAPHSEKERNFQTQQRRLQAFTALPANKINPDLLIHSILGKTERDFVEKSKRSVPTSSVSTSANNKTDSVQSKARDWSNLEGIEKAFQQDEGDDFSDFVSALPTSSMTSPESPSVMRSVYFPGGAAVGSRLAGVLPLSPESSQFAPNKHLASQVSSQNSIPAASVPSLLCLNEPCSQLELNPVFDDFESFIGLNRGSSKDQTVVAAQNGTKSVCEAICTDGSRDDDFADFQQASAPVQSAQGLNSVTILNSALPTISSPKPNSKGPMETASSDKYSAFRDFVQPQIVEPVGNTDLLGQTELHQSFPDFKPGRIEASVVSPTYDNGNSSLDQSTDEFGDFVVPSSVQSTAVVASLAVPSVKDDSNSVLSLDLHMTIESPTDGTGSDDADNVSALSMDDSASYNSADTTSGNGVSLSLSDKYSIIKEEICRLDSNLETSERWSQCLASVAAFMNEALATFNKSSPEVCSEVVNTAEGESYFRGVVEVYRVCCRVALSIKTGGYQGDDLHRWLCDINITWSNLEDFIANTTLMPDESVMDFTAFLLAPVESNTGKACGVCLLNVDSCLPASSGETESHHSYQGHDRNKLSYGGRQYHASCANFWVNCVDSILPQLGFRS